MITIYHNGECSKSKGALEILQEKGILHEVRWYLADPLTASEIRNLLKKLGLDASDLIRKSEPFFQEHLEGKTLSQAAYIRYMVEHPELIERPIIENDERAIVARPPERVLEVL